MELPSDTQAHKFAAELSDKPESALTELGIDVQELYRMPYAEQNALMEQTVNAVVSDRELKQLNRLMAERLTGGNDRGRVSETENIRFEQMDVHQQYKMMQDVGVMRLPSADAFAQMQENGSREYQNLVARYQNLTGERPWSAVEFNPENSMIMR